MPRTAGLDPEAVVPGKVEVLRVVDGLGARDMREDRGLAVVDHHLLRHATEPFERALVTAEEPLLRLAQRKLDVQPAAVAQDEDEEAERPPRAVHLDRAEASPIDLRTLA